MLKAIEMWVGPLLLGPPRGVLLGPFVSALLAITVAGASAQTTSTRTSPSQESASANSLKGLTLEQLSNIEVVTYNKTPSDLMKTPAAVYVITNEDILRSGATSIADALRLAPGVEVARLSSTTWAVSIRGLQNNFSKSVLVLIDGRNVYTPLFAGVYWDVQDMPLEDIDRVEVIRGPGGTIWGPNAGNGVINIITKNAADTSGVAGSALAGGQNHTIDDLQYGGTTKPHLDYRIFGRGFERAHEYHPDGINEDAWHQERVGFRADYDSERDSYFAEGDAYRGDSPHIVGTTPFYDEVSGGDLNLRWERRLSDENRFYLQTYFDRTLRTDPVFLSESRNTFDLEFVHHFAIGAHQHFSYGGGVRFSPYLTHEEATDSLSPTGGVDHVHTAFVQDEIVIGPKVSVTGGAKLQHNNYSGFDVQPSARVLWAISQRQSLWAGITRAVTTPSDLEENFLIVAPEAPNTFLQLLGNKQFKSEDVVGYEAGYRIVNGDRFYLDIASYWNQYSRLQSFSALTPSVSGANTYLTIQYENQIAGHTTGFEFAPRFSIASWWRVSSGYSFVSSTFAADGPTSNISSTGSVATYEGSTPRHDVFVESKLNLPYRIQFDPLYRYVSHLPAQKVAAYQTMDIHAARPLGRGVTLEAVGQNLFQPHHAEWGTGDPRQPVVGIYRAAYLRVSFSRHPRP